MTERIGSGWILHHAYASCFQCPWSHHEEHNGSVDVALREARRHHRRSGHYVQVERGQHMHYGERF